jgi:hypothetical protein
MKYRVFLYGDDLVVFVTPVLQDIRVAHAVLEIFVEPSGLCTNIFKCLMTLIQCSDVDVALIQQVFPC